MNLRLTRKYIIKSLQGIDISTPIRYERYYINDNLRIQRKDRKYEKEILQDNVVVDKIKIDENEFDSFKNRAYNKIIRDSYLYLKDDRVSIKQYHDKYENFIRVEVKFESKEEMELYVKEEWMGDEITTSPLAFDVYLSKLSDSEFKYEISKYI